MAEKNIKELSQVTSLDSTDAVEVDNGTRSAYILKADLASELGGAPAGATTQIQFNNAGVFGASSDFIWDDSTKKLLFNSNASVEWDGAARLKSGGGNDLLIQYDSINSKTKFGVGATNHTTSFENGKVGIGTTTPNTTLDIQGGQTVKITTVNTATYDLLITDYIVHVTYTTTGAVTSLTLPTAQTTAGRTVIIKDAGGNAGTNSITIDTEGGEKIDGIDTLVIGTNYTSHTLYSDGTNWFKI